MIEDLESRILDLEHKLLRLPDLAPRIAALEMCTEQLWTELGLPTNCVVNVSIFNNVECRATDQNPSEVTSVGTVTVTDSDGTLFSGPWGSGAGGGIFFSLTIPNAGDTIHVAVTGVSRFQDASTDFTLTCAGPNVVSFVLHASDGYVCLCEGVADQLCVYPFKTTLKLTDSYWDGVMGGGSPYPITLTWDAGTCTWVGTAVVNTLDCPPGDDPNCGAVTGVTLTYKLVVSPGTLNCSVTYEAAALLSCPSAVHVPGITNPLTLNFVFDSLTCPLSFAASYHWSATGAFGLYCTHGSTISITE